MCEITFAHVYFASFSTFLENSHKGEGIILQEVTGQLGPLLLT